MIQVSNVAKERLVGGAEIRNLRGCIQKVKGDND